MKNISEFYDKTADTWAKNGYTDESVIPSLCKFVKNHLSGSKFLDICCGCGYESKRIYDFGYEVVGIDISEKSISLARKYNPDIKFYVDNLLNDYSYIGKVDAIIVIAGLVHIDNHDLRVAFKHMYDVLKENGDVYITIYEGKGKIPERSQCVIDGEKYDRHFIAHTLNELIEYSKNMFLFKCEAENTDENWKSYIFEKI